MNLFGKIRRVRPLLSFSLAILIVGYLVIPIQASQNKRPNVILIMADDMGYGDPGFMGNKIIKTPSLDAMAQNGLVFKRFYSQSPVCSPTRGSCLTGRHPYRYGIYSANVGHLPTSEISLTQLLKGAGYVTGHFGKWHLGTLTKTEKDSNRGGRKKGAQHYAPPWDRHFDQCFSTEAKVPTWDPYVSPKNGKYYGTAYWTGPGKKVNDNVKGDDSRVIMDRAIPFIQKAAKEKKPFFTVIWFHSPHEPVIGGPTYLKQYAKVANKKAQAYYSCITALDEQVGRLRQELQRLGIAEDTIVFFCSDNGPEHATGPGSTGSLSGRKRSLLEGGIRVPGIVEWPAQIKGGRTTIVPACTSDYLPTIVDIVNLKLPKDRPFDGISLLPLIKGEMKERPRPIAFESANQLALVDNQYSLYSANRGKTWKLFDLSADSGQKKDISGQHPKIVQQMSAYVTQWRASCTKSREKAGIGKN